MLKVIALVVPLGLDSFAICAALGIAGIDRAQRRRVLVLFPTLEAAAPLLGLAIGAPLGAAVGGAADYAAIAILFALGLFTLLGGEQGEGDQVDGLATAHGLAIVGLGFAIALDELVIGFTIGLLGLSLVPVLVLIALQAVVLSQLGLRLGAGLGERARETVERSAGLALVAVGAALLVEKLVSS